MGKINKYLLTAVSGILLLGATSCDNEEFMSVEHYSILPPDLMFQTDADAQAGLVGCYDMMLPSNNGDDTGLKTNGDWGFKPNLFLGGHPTMDTQATGWDKDWNSANWNSGSSELLSGWRHCFMGIGRCNTFLVGLKDATNVSAELKPVLEGQAKALRGFFYMWLAQSFGGVPLLEEGEDYINTQAKARCTDEEIWNVVIKNFEEAAELLEWDPANGQYGRCTKGMALSYLGEAYMWKAYKIYNNEGVEATSLFEKAKSVLNEVIASGTYALNASFTTLFDPIAWQKESVWEEVLDEGNNWGGWNNLTGAYMYIGFYSACPDLGGWGSLYLSWEWWSSYEKGDKRRDASGCTGLVENIDPKFKSDYCYGRNPYVLQDIDGAKAVHYHYYNDGEAAPSIWTLKYWRTMRPSWGGPASMHMPTHVYYKRYANVLFDYAECLFRLNGADDVEAWGIIDQIRNRAFGNEEVGKKESLTALYNPYYESFADYYSATKPAGYPIPFNEATVTVPSAKGYYETEKEAKEATIPTWLWALGQERRKEFNAEWSLRPDLQRSGFLEEHIKCNYPTGEGLPSTDPAVADNWHTYRTFEYDANRYVFPIPTDEMMKNPLMEQNPGY